MRTYVAGKAIGDHAVLVDKSFLTESVIGQIYELKIKTYSVSQPEYIASVLSKSLREKFSAKLLYFEVDDNIITIQIEGSPFAWNLLLAFLPELLVGLGITILFILVYLVTSSVPSWQYGLAAFALSLMFIAPGAISKVAMMKGGSGR